jgi:hypothetical protein
MVLGFNVCDGSSTPKLGRPRKLQADFRLTAGFGERTGRKVD